MCKRIIFIFIAMLAMAGSAPAYGQLQYEAHRRFAQRIGTSAQSGVVGQVSLAEYMRQEKVHLAEGTFATLLTLADDSTANVELALVDGKRYALKLSQGDHHAVLTYPADYQLIMGVTMMEMENRLWEQVVLSMPSVSLPVAVDTTLLIHDDNGPVYVQKGRSYLLDEFNANRYFVRNPDDGAFSPLYSEDFPLETMANLVAGVIADPAISIEITLVKYGYRTETFTVPLQQWVAFCLTEGCEPYYGVISHDRQEVVCEVVLHNEALGYAHVMKMKFSPAIFADRKGTVTARLNSYVPLSNVKSIFYEEY